MDFSLTTGFLSPKRSRDFRETDPWTYLQRGHLAHEGGVNRRGGVVHEK